MRDPRDGSGGGEATNSARIEALLHMEKALALLDATGEPLAAAHLQQAIDRLRAGRRSPRNVDPRIR